MENTNEFEYVQVLVDVARLDTRTFSYKIPDDLKSKIKIGQILLVPFGMQGAINAFVVGFTNYVPDGIKIKQIYEITEEEPIFSLEYLQFLEWVAGYYCTSLQNVIETAIPSAFITKIKKIIALKNWPQESTKLSKEEEILLAILKEKQKISQTSLSKTSKIKGNKFYETLRKLKTKELKL